MQRFLSEDPIGIQGGINLYAYVAFRPLVLRDPSGNRPGDFYISEWDAAVDAINDVKLNSIFIGREIGGAIFKMGGGYSYTVPIIMGTDSGFIPISDSSTAIYHTHGAADAGYDNNSFSAQDIATAEGTGLNMYLGTPNGAFLFYSPMNKKGDNACNL